MKEIIFTDKAPLAIGPYSQAVKINNMVYTSGQIPLKPDTGEVLEGDIKDQARLVLENLQAVLIAAGSSFDKVVKTTCFLKDMGDFLAFNEIYASYFNQNPPARSCVAVKTLPKDVLVEVEAVAYI